MEKLKVLVTLLTLRSALAQYVNTNDRPTLVTDVPIHVIKTDSREIELKLQYSFEQSDKWLKSLPGEIASVLLNEATGAIPVVGPIATSAVQVAKLLLSDEPEKDWVTPLLDAIEKYVDQKIDRKLVKEKVVDVQDHLKTLTTSITNVVNSNLTEVSTKKNFIDSAEATVSYLVQRYANRESLFRKFPLVALPPLFGLAAFLVPLEAWKYEFKKDLVKVSNLPCDFAEVLLEYRTLTVLDRVKWLRYEDPTYTFTRENYTHWVQELKYNTSGYQNSDSITCMKDIPGEYKVFDDKPRIVDQFEGTLYEAPLPRVKDEPWLVETVPKLECYTGYIRVLRAKVEKAFDDGPLSTVNKLCESSKQAKRILARQ